MEKFKELLFLNSINRVAKKTIYGKYWDILVNAENFEDLVNKMGAHISEEKINDALNKYEKIYNQVINDSEIHVITVFDDNYPQNLNVMEKERPLFLFIKGNVEALKKPNIAFIGTRKPTDLSEEFEKETVKKIIETSDRVIVSGLALGCDKIAHQTTVDENKTTIAILPSGVNKITPASNKKLANEIIQTGGCLISEYYPDVKANKGSYVARDKVVAAFCEVTFVVECGVQSGTMYTVDAARNYLRQIYAYLPDERVEGVYDGNEFILTEDYDAIKVDNIEEFLNDLKSLKPKKEKKSLQQTLV